MRRPARGWGMLRVAGDLLLGAVAFRVAFLLRLHFALPGSSGLLPADRLSFLSLEWPAVLLVQTSVLYFFGFYDPPRPLARADLARRLASALALQGLILVSYLFLTRHAFPRTVLLLYLLCNFLLLFLWRWTLQRLYRIPERRVALVGSGAAAREIAAGISERRWHGMVVVGYVPAPGEEPSAGDGRVIPAALGRSLGVLADLPGLLQRGEVDDLILAVDANNWQTALIDQLSGTRPEHSTVLLLPGPFEALIGRMRYRWVHDIPLIEVVRESEWRINWPLKRTLDLLAGALLAVLTLPAMAGVALFIRWSAGPPVLYHQTRVGRGRRPLRLIKFRTMRPDAESEGGEVLAQAGDPRFIRGGALVRRLRLDELPQLWNVLAGSMSLVGPRPERPGFVERYLREVPGYAERFSVAPGLTGLAQVNGDYHSTAANKLRYDLAYIANWSVWLDLSILFRTVKIVLTSRGV